jgi:hypothetical protein
MKMEINAKHAVERERPVQLGVINMTGRNEENDKEGEAFQDRKQPIRISKCLKCWKA